MLAGVLTHLGCCNKMPQTGWLINNRNLWLTVLEPGKSKIKVLAWSHFGEDTSWSIVGTFSLCLHMMEGARDLFIRALTDPRGLHPHDLITSQLPHLLTLSHGHYSSSMRVWQGHKHSDRSGRLKQDSEYKALSGTLPFSSSFPLRPKTQMEQIFWPLLSILLLWHLPPTALYCSSSFYVYPYYLPYQIINSPRAESLSLFIFPSLVIVACHNTVPSIW